MAGLTSAGMSGRNNASVGAQFFRRAEALDLIDLASNHCGERCSDPWHTEQVLMHRLSFKLGPDPFFLRLHLLRNEIVQGELFAQKCRVRFRQF